MRALTGWSGLTVRGPSMTPTLGDGDYLLVRRISRRRPLRPGDVVVADIPGRPAMLVKRISHRAPDGWWLLSDNEFVTSDSRRYGAFADGAVRWRAVVRIRDSTPGWAFWRVRITWMSGLVAPPRE